MTQTQTTLQAIVQAVQAVRTARMAMRAAQFKAARTFDAYDIDAALATEFDYDQAYVTLEQLEGR